MSRKTTIVIFGSLLTLGMMGTASAGSLSFEQIDTDKDGNVTFSEFYLSHQDSGKNDADLAAFFTTISNGEPTFSDVDYIVFQKNNRASPMNDIGARKPMVQDMNNLGPNAGAFAKLDANSDGKVTFNEYSAVVTKDRNVPRTLAAQEFIRISQGQASFDHSQYELAITTDDTTRRVYKAW